MTGADENNYRVQDTVRITSGAATNYMVKTGSDHKMRILKTKNGQDAELGHGDYITQRSSDNKNIIYINSAELMFVNGKNETLYKGAKGEV